MRNRTVAILCSLVVLVTSLLCPRTVVAQFVPNCDQAATLGQYRVYPAPTGPPVMAIYHWPPDIAHPSKCNVHAACYWGIPLVIVYEPPTMPYPYDPYYDYKYVNDTIGYPSFSIMNGCDEYYEWDTYSGLWYYPKNQMTLKFCDEANWGWGADLGANVRYEYDASTTWRVRIAGGYAWIRHDAPLYTSDPTNYSRGETVVHELGHMLLMTWHTGDGQYKATASQRTYNFGPSEAAYLKCVYGEAVMADCNNLVLAECDDFWVADGGLASWRVLHEHATQYYAIQGRVNQEESWHCVVDSIAPGVGSRFVNLPTPLCGQYRLLEVAGIGTPAVLGYASPSAGYAASMAYSGGSIEDGIDAYLDKIATGEYCQQGINMGAGQSCLIIGPAQWTALVEELLGPLWSGLWGFDLAYCNVDARLGDQVEARNAIKNAIVTAYANGTKYFLLLGDANDYRQFVGDEYGAFWNSTEWESKRQALIAGGTMQGERSNDIVPSYYVADNALSPSLNMARVTPYWYTDQYYADIDADESPEAVIGRWPVSTNDEVLSMILKTMRYNDNNWGAQRYVVDMYQGDLSYRQDPYEALSDLDGPLLRKSADDVVALFPENAHLWVNRMSNCDNYSELSMTFCELWNETYPELVYILSNGSNRYSMGGYINVYDQGISGQMTPYHNPLVVGATCAVNDYARSCRTDKPVPMIEALMLNAWTGPIACVGPTGGSVQTANVTMAKKMAERLYAEGNRSIAEAYTEAVSACMEEHQAEDQQRHTIRSYVYLGDPLSRLCNHDGHSVGIREADAIGGPAELVVSPNPASGRVRVTIRYAEKTRMDKAEVYNVRGERIRTIGCRSEGDSSADGAVFEWDGMDGLGRRVPSGRYVIRVVGAGREAVARVVIIR